MLVFFWGEIPTVHEKRNPNNYRQGFLLRTLMFTMQILCVLAASKINKTSHNVTIPRGLTARCADIAVWDNGRHFSSLTVVESWTDVECVCLCNFVFALELLRCCFPNDHALCTYSLLYSDYPILCVYSPPRPLVEAKFSVSKLSSQIPET